MHEKKTIILQKFKESMFSVLPITLIIVLLCFAFVPITTDAMLSFLVGAAMLVFGIGFFSLGVENAMTPIGNYTGTWMTKTQKLWIILPMGFLLGAAIAVAEPNLQLLALNAPFIDKTVLTITIAIAVGFMLFIAMLRMYTGIKLKWILMILYAAVFISVLFIDPGFLGVSFDAGGIITGPVAVPFVMAIGVGAASLRNDKNAAADSFGLVSLIAVGPILMIMILSFFYSGNAAVIPSVIGSYADTLEISSSYLKAIPSYLSEVARALLPIFAFFLIFQIFVLKLNRNTFIRITAGVIYTYIGLVLFLTGVNVSFSPIGSLIGSVLAEEKTKILLIPVGMAMGWFSISAEPSVQVLNKQVEEISGGAITAKAMGTSLSIAVACAMAFSMIRVLNGMSLLWFLIPGYAISLILMFFVPDIFTSIAFDSGGVASGPMTATFMLPFAIGATAAVGGNIVTDAFGLVALVAMMPLITIQIMGVVYKIKLAKAQAETVVFGDTDVIDLWEGRVWN